MVVSIVVRNYLHVDDEFQNKIMEKFQAHYDVRMRPVTPHSHKKLLLNREIL